MSAMSHTEVKALQEKIAAAIEKTREQLEHCQPEKVVGWQARLRTLREVAEWVGCVVD
ncbi:hypothetical protein IGB42_01868 [Andreprevotia sp. IGB-42]|uniref:hypothetical protein n=1 Tax=Andreprevotia sp. IGB-42 TaxID=2497473 RepID=UPI00135A44D5|nr:hypothetical protein [Andreprevotia sp. IGB-42]KAF0813517.1 hypothetical protein IGB42_01868 [Andreprevotia sp. IGB-42]